MSNETEFLRHVYNPVTDDTFLAGSYDSPEISLIDELIDSKLRLAEEIYADPETIDVLRLLIAKTKTQVRTDLSLVFRDTRSPEDDESLCGCAHDELTTHGYDYFQNFITSSRRSYREQRAAAETIAQYFTKEGVAGVLEDFASLSSNERARILDNAILPHDQRGSHSKRRGHGVEAELAQMLEECGAAVTPNDKSSNPMGGDPEFAGMSFDMLIGDEDVALISLFHTSNPGQYGSDKTKKTAEYAEAIDSINGTELWAFCDGAGFTMHNSALHNVIDNVDNFVQVKSLWKLPAQLHKNGVISLKSITFSDFYTTSEKIVFSMEYGIPLGERVDATPVRAGEATLWV